MNRSGTAPRRERERERESARERERERAREREREHSRGEKTWRSRQRAMALGAFTLRHLTYQCNHVLDQIAGCMTRSQKLKGGPTRSGCSV